MAKIQKKEDQRLLFPALILKKFFRGLFSAQTFIGHGEFLSAFGSACGQHSATVSRGHSLSEPVFMSASRVRGLVRSFHISTILYLRFFWTAKIHFFLFQQPTFEKIFPNILCLL